MKTLLIIRHAKSDTTFWGNDFERPLNERGKKDAPVIAERIKDRNICIDVFISSPAKRAKKTAELFFEELGTDKNGIDFISALYHATEEIFYDVVAGINDAFSTAALFSHNPGISNFVNGVTETIRIDNMPTCGVFALQAHCNSWKEFKKSKKDFLFFDYPKI